VTSIPVTAACAPDPRRCLWGLQRPVHVAAQFDQGLGSPAVGQPGLAALLDAASVRDQQIAHRGVGDVGGEERAAPGLARGVVRVDQVGHAREHGLGLLQDGVALLDAHGLGTAGLADGLIQLEVLDQFGAQHGGGQILGQVVQHVVRDLLPATRNRVNPVKNALATALTPSLDYRRCASAAPAPPSAGTTTHGSPRHPSSSSAYPPASRHTPRSETPPSIRKTADWS
jgi:hypothetical protein